jgi:putative transposase
MNPSKCDELDYIHFVIAAQRVPDSVGAARCQLQDAFTRLITRQPPDTEVLWQETEGLVNLKKEVLVLDDTTLDKPSAKHIELVTRHWSGKHHRVVLGINLISLLWTDGNALLTCLASALGGDSASV